MAIYIVSDTHFFHPMWTRHEPKRVEKVTQSWKEQVSSKDTIIHLGDIGGNDEIVAKRALHTLQYLPGYKILVKGNHDRLSDKDYLEAFDQVHETYILEDKHLIFSHKPLEVVPEGFINVHGHMHVSTVRFPQVWPYYGKNVNSYRLISLEKMGFRVFSLEEVLSSTNCAIEIAKSLGLG